MVYSFVSFYSLLLFSICSISCFLPCSLLDLIFLFSTSLIRLFTSPFALIRFLIFSPYTSSLPSSPLLSPFIQAISFNLFPPSLLFHFLSHQQLYSLLSPFPSLILLRFFHSSSSSISTTSTRSFHLTLFPSPQLPIVFTPSVPLPFPSPSLSSLYLYPSPFPPSIHHRLPHVLRLIPLPLSTHPSHLTSLFIPLHFPPPFKPLPQFPGPPFNTHFTPTPSPSPTLLREENRSIVFK